MLLKTLVVMAVSILCMSCIMASYAVCLKRASQSTDTVLNVIQSKNSLKTYEYN